MESEKFYIVSELATELDVPRTTVNDWLSRYEDYIEFTMRGRRKVYSANALELLRSIKKLRDDGMNGFDIGEYLAKQYPVKPQLAELPFTKSAGADAKNDEQVTDNSTNSSLNNNNSSSAVDNKNDGASATANLPAAQLNYEAINSEFLKINDFLKTAELKQQRSSRLNRIFFTSLIALVIILGVCSVVFGYKLYGKMNSSFNEVRTQIGSNNLTFVEQLDKHNQDAVALRTVGEKVLADARKELKAVTLLLENNRKDYQRNVELLQNELKQQQLEFDKKLQILSQSSENAATAAMLKAKNEFAAERLEFLKKLESMEKNLNTKNGELVKMQQDLLKKISAPVPSSAQNPAAATPPPQSGGAAGATPVAK